MFTQTLTNLRELCAMSLSLQNFHGSIVWVACNGACRYVVSRTKAAEIFEQMKAEVRRD